MNKDSENEGGKVTSPESVPFQSKSPGKYSCGKVTHYFTAQNISVDFPN